MKRISKVGVKKVKQKKCRFCGELFIPKSSLQVMCSQICFYQSQKERKPKCKPLPKSKKSISKVKKDKSDQEKLRDKVWRLWSAYIRKKEKYICFTCGRQKDKNTTHAGHYKHGKLDFDPMNIHCQCEYCNKYLHGNLGVYATKLIDKYGRDKFDDLVLRANKHNNKYSISELEEIVENINKKTIYSKNLPF